MIALQEERNLINQLKDRLVTNENLSKAELLELCTQFEKTLELATVSLKIIDRLRVNIHRINIQN